MTKIGYRFIIYSLMMLFMFNCYELASRANGKEGVVIEHGYYRNSCRPYSIIDLDNFFLNVCVDGNNNSIGTKVKINASNETNIKNLAIGPKLLVSVVLMFICFVSTIILLFRIDSEWYRDLPD